MDQLLPILAGIALGGLFLAAADYRPNLARVLIGLVLLGGAVYNSLVTFPGRGWILEQMVNQPFVPAFYRDITTALIIPNATAFVLLLVAFEATAGLAIMARGTPVMPALAAAALFFLSMIPMAPPEGIIATAVAQGAMALACVQLLRRRFPASIPGLLFTRPNRPARPRSLTSRGVLEESRIPASFDIATGGKRE